MTTISARATNLGDLTHSSTSSALRTALAASSALWAAGATNVRGGGRWRCQSDRILYERARPQESHAHSLVQTAGLIDLLPRRSCCQRLRMEEPLQHVLVRDTRPGRDEVASPPPCIQHFMLMLRRSKGLCRGQAVSRPTKPIMSHGGQAHATKPRSKISEASAASLGEVGLGRTASSPASSSSSSLPSSSSVSALWSPGLLGAAAGIFNWAAKPSMMSSIKSGSSSSSSPSTDFAHQPRLSPNRHLKQ